jgi:Pentapeptide repeats (8 copies)
MDENHQNKTTNRLIATEDNLWLPPLSPKDQKKLNHLRSKGKKSASEWTGFAGRSLWDWLQFFGVLAIPIIVAAGTLYFTQQITLQQAEFAQQQAKLNIAANQQQHETDLQIAGDQQQETTLKTYLDDMSDLLLNHNLSKSKPGDVVSEVARERTLTTLRRLGADRNKIVLQFLQDAHLIGPTNKTVIDFSHTDLSYEALSGANFSHVNLTGTYFDEPFTIKAYPADLTGALQLHFLSSTIV